MSDFVILSLILFLVVCLILTLAGFVFYTGLLSQVVVRTGPPPVKQLTIAYKLKKGSYRDCGSAFTESCSIAPHLRSIALYYDNPNQVRHTGGARAFPPPAVFARVHRRLLLCPQTFGPFS